MNQILKRLRLNGCRALVLGIVFLNAPYVKAAEIEQNYAYSKVAMPEILIGVGTRATAMGGAGIAASNDLASLYWNPAGLQQMNNAQMEFIHNSWIQDIMQETLLLSIPFSSQFVVGLGGTYFGLGSIEKTGITADGRIIRDGANLNLNMMGGSVGAGFSISPGVALGAAARYFTQNLGEVTQTSMSGDLGLQYHSTDDLTWGLAIKNLGTGVSGYGLPMSTGVGCAYSAKLNKNDFLMLGMDVDLLFHDMGDSILHLGMEYNFGKFVQIRAGYQLTGAKQPTGLGGLTAGAGVAMGIINLGYALAPQGDLGMTHRISMMLDFKAFSAANKPAPKREVSPRTVLAPRTEFGVENAPEVVVDRRLGGEVRSGSAVTKEEEAMRSLLKENIQVEARVTKALAKNKGAREVHFRVKRSSGARVASWIVELLNPDGKQVQLLKGDELPKIIRWDGRNAQDQVVEDVRDIRYNVTLTDVNGQKESVKGRVGISKTGTLPAPQGQKEPALVDSVAFDPLVFSKNQAEITDKMAEVISEAATFIRDHPDTKVFIEGYTDSVDEQEKKIYLSKARAESVARYLTAYHKIPISRILIRGRGDKDPIANNDDSDERAKNRRVVITVRGIKRR